jgi:predicted nucleic acid-binding protein
MAHKPLLDVNICLDLFLKRNPHFHSAAQIFQASELGKIRAVVSAISFDTLFYIMSLTHSSQDATSRFSVNRDRLIAAYTPLPWILLVVVFSL